MQIVPRNQQKKQIKPSRDTRRIDPRILQALDAVGYQVTARTVNNRRLPLVIIQQGRA